MASEPKVLFEVDAAKILAKLHLAGVQAAGHGNDSFIVNTGIKNDDQGAKPENPGKVEFDLTNSQSEYEVGYVTQIEFVAGSSNDAIFKVLSNVNAILTNSKAEIEKTSATGDEAKKVETKYDGNFKKLKPNLEKFSKEVANKELKDVIDVIIASQSISDFNQSWNKFDNKTSFGQKITDLKKSLESDENKAKEDYNKQKEAAMKDASVRLTTYLNTFVGPDQIDKSKLSNPFMMIVSDKVKDSNDKNLVANYELQPISEQEADKKKAEYSVNAGKKCTQKLCFKVKYSIQLDK